MGFQLHHSALIVASLVTVASFVGATAYTQNRLVRLDALSTTIETNAVPSIEYLSRAAVRLTRLKQTLKQAGTPAFDRDAATATAREDVAALQADIRRYLALPTLAGENAIWAELRTNIDRVNTLISSALRMDDEGGNVVDAAFDRTINVALDDAIASVLTALDFDVRQSETMARDVRQVRASTLREIVALDAAATTLALLGLFVAFRASRRHDVLQRDHAALLAGRVHELDLFTGRVAHDLISPLAAIATALTLVGYSCDEQNRPYIERSQRVVRRIQQLVMGLLEFARSGAHPDPAARCALDDAVTGILAESAQTAAAKDIDLSVEARAAVDVRCNPAVAASIVQNLIGNAIKYIGNGPVRRIVVRTMQRGSVARLEVEDTGPGIPTDLQATIFDPFVRGKHSEIAGAGLGLATVKRLVESHHGELGVKSALGSGTLFWIELPIASR